MDLFFRKSGDGAPLVILHGLFGSSDNWFSLSKVFASDFSVYTIDQRNHGQSPHSSDINYRLLADDLDEFLAKHEIKNPIVIGHSMGGKTAMNLAIKNPSAIAQLIVVDIAPKSYPPHHDHILEGLTAMALPTLTSRGEADKILSAYVPEPDVRQFLLKNLTRNNDGNFEWKINLSAIQNHIDEIGMGMQYEGVFDKPTLFINGTRSNYFKPEDEVLAMQFFPLAIFESIDASHWVQAEKPEEFVQVVKNFLKH